MCVCVCVYLFVYLFVYSYIYISICLIYTYYIYIYTCMHTQLDMHEIHEPMIHMWMCTLCTYTSASTSCVRTSKQEPHFDGKTQQNLPVAHSHTEN